MKKKDEITSPLQFLDGTYGGNIIKQEGDHAEQYMTEHGREIVTKANTHEVNVTHQQYLRKDGTKGKQTITFKELEK